MFMTYTDYLDTLALAVETYRNGNRTDAIKALADSKMPRPLHYLKQYLQEVEVISREEANRQVLELALLWEYQSA